MISTLKIINPGTSGHKWVQVGTSGYNWVQVGTIGYNWVQLRTIGACLYHRTKDTQSRSNKSWGLICTRSLYRPITTMTIKEAIYYRLKP